MAGCPLLFLDVDGLLIPFGGSTLVMGFPRTQDEEPDGNPLLARLNPEHGAWLRALPCELVWATSWMGEANEVISPRLGLPHLPVVEWSEDDADDGGPEHWKTPGIVRWAAGRPFVWIDDEIADVDRAWVAAHHPGPALLHRVDPRRGLTSADVAAVRAWLDQLKHE